MSAGQRFLPWTLCTDKEVSDLAWSVSFSGKAEALYIVMTDSKGVPFKTMADDNQPLFHQLDGQYMKLLVARPGGTVSVSNLIKMPN